MIYANPNTEGAVIHFKEKYDNFIGGKWVAPVKGQYFENKSPVTVHLKFQFNLITHDFKQFSFITTIQQHSVSDPLH